jgi:thymidylate kinase
MAAVLNTYHEKIIPLLEQGISVICDRSHISTLAYQVNAQQKLGNYLPADLAKLAYKDIKIDALVLLFGDPIDALKRVVRRDGQKDRIESRPLEYFEGIQSFYDSYAYQAVLYHPVYRYENRGDLMGLQQFATKVFKQLTM